MHSITIQTQYMYCTFVLTDTMLPTGSAASSRNCTSQVTSESTATATGSAGWDLAYAEGLKQQQLGVRPILRCPSLPVTTRLLLVRGRLKWVVRCT
jgi:hypothetical protein